MQEEEEEVNLKAEKVIGSEEEECIGVKDEEGVYSEEDKEEEENGIDIKEEAVEGMVIKEEECVDIKAEVSLEGTV